MNTARVAALVLMLALQSACVPSTPNRSDWAHQASQALEDVAGQVATSRLVLREQQQDDLLGKTAVVMLVDAEEAVGTTSQSLTSMQRPKRTAQAYEEVTTEIERASTLVTKVRTAVLEDDREAFTKLLSRLRHIEQRLTRLAEMLR